jgi:hypothetical protein
MCHRLKLPTEEEIRATEALSHRPYLLQRFIQEQLMLLPDEEKAQMREEERSKMMEQWAAKFNAITNSQGSRVDCK